MTDVKLKAPFPWFGGKSRTAGIVWARFGRVQNYVEPFAGSLANLLGNPAQPGALPVETVNDVDACLCNFWRATQWAPGDVAHWADWPVNEVDLHARHRWCHARMSDSTGLNARQLKRVNDDGLGALAVRLEEDAEYFDAQLAGWWVWGLSAWIGDNWCSPKEQKAAPNLYHHGNGVNQKEFGTKRPAIGGNTKAGSQNFGRGVHSNWLNSGESGELWLQRPQTKGSMGVHAARAVEGETGRRDACGTGSLSMQKPYMRGAQGVESIDAGGTPAPQGTPLGEYFEALSVRLRRVRVCCGDWARVCTPSVTVSNGLTGVFLDPPYGVSDRDKVYNHDSLHVSAAVREWAIVNGENRQMRIALCGYADEHVMPAAWDCVAWKAAGGYGNQRKDKTNVNAGRERIWFSPHCLKPSDDLFDGGRA